MILATGCNGMVGSYLWKSVFKTDVYDLDVTNRKDVARYDKFNPSAIIHLAAETDLEKCEKERDYAYRVNTIGTYNMTALAVKLDVPIVYISTAGVFNGQKKTPYTERDKPDPINIYGVTKWYGEDIVRAYPKHYIFRAGWMMGGGRTRDKKFIAKIIQRIENGENGLQVIDDSFGSPTYAKDLVRAIRQALTWKIAYGTYHACGDGSASRYEVACEIVRLMGYRVNLIPISSKRYNDNKHTCVRSTNETMSIKKLRHHGIAMRPWKRALKDYLKEWKPLKETNKYLNCKICGQAMKLWHDLLGNPMVYQCPLCDVAYEIETKEWV